MQDSQNVQSSAAFDQSSAAFEKCTVIRSASKCLGEMAVGQEVDVRWRGRLDLRFLAEMRLLSDETDAC